MVGPKKIVLKLTFWYLEVSKYAMLSSRAEEDIFDKIDVEILIF